MVRCLSTRNLENTVFCNINDILSHNTSALRGNGTDTCMSVALCNMPIIMIRSCSINILKASSWQSCISFPTDHLEH